eukprot:1148668_1
MTSNPRKQRTIKNSIVKIDDVDFDPGVNFANWIQITKCKLWDRELSLLEQRLEACYDSNLSMMKMFVINHAEILDRARQNAYEMETTLTLIYQTHWQRKIADVRSPIIVGYMKSVERLLTQWNGYHPTEKTVIQTYRHYFQKCRAWFDHTKMQRMALDVWIPMMRLIEEVSRRAASQTFHQHTFCLQNAYSDYLYTWMVIDLFEERIKPNNCGYVWLIPTTVYETLYKQYWPKNAVMNVPKKTKTSEI